jgi:hypothetical protein
MLWRYNDLGLPGKLKKCHLEPVVNISTVNAQKKKSDLASTVGWYVYIIQINIFSWGRIQF